MPRNPNPVASATKAIIRASPPLKTITKASISLNKAAISNRHYVRALLSLVATRNLIKSVVMFRPVNRKTLKPGSPLWKMFLKAIWMAIWPAIGKSLAERFVKQPVAEAVEVKACEEDVVSTKEEDVVVKIEPKQVAGALATYAAELRAIELRAAESARLLDEQERAFQEQFAQAEGLMLNEQPSFPIAGTAELTVATKHEKELAQMWEREELAKRPESAPTVELVMRGPPSQAVQNNIG